MIGRRSLLAGAVALAPAFVGSVAHANVINYGPPLGPIGLNQRDRRVRIQRARSAVSLIFDFSVKQRAEFLNEAYRQAGQHNIKQFSRVVEVQHIGERVVVCAICEVWLGPQTIGDRYVYFQCNFNDSNEVVKIEVM